MTGSIRKRGQNSWESTLDLGRDERGKRVRRFSTVQGNKKQAQRRLRELLTELDGGIAPSNERIRMRDWLERWMTECVVGHLSQAAVDRLSHQPRADARHFSGFPHVAGSLGTLHEFPCVSLRPLRLSTTRSGTDCFARDCDVSSDCVMPSEKTVFFGGKPSVACRASARLWPSRSTPDHASKNVAKGTLGCVRGAPGSDQSLARRGLCREPSRAPVRRAAPIATLGLARADLATSAAFRRDDRRPFEG